MFTLPSMQSISVQGALRFHFVPSDIALHCSFVPLNSIVAREVQPLNEKLPMLVTQLGIVTLVREVQLPNAPLGIALIFSDIFTDANCLQPWKAY